jgi:hypothetical protein
MSLLLIDGQGMRSPSCRTGIPWFFTGARCRGQAGTRGFAAPWLFSSRRQALDLLE